MLFFSEGLPLKVMAFFEISKMGSTYILFLSVTVPPINLCTLWLLVDTCGWGHHFNSPGHGLRLLKHWMDCSCSDSLGGVENASKGTWVGLGWRKSHVLPLRREVVERIGLKAGDVAAWCRNPDS